VPDLQRLPRLDAFLLPKGVYLDGNSLGPLSHGAQAAIERRLRQWQYHGVAGWDDWFGLAERLSGALGRLLGAYPDEVIATGSITVNLHALLATFHRPVGRRRALLATELDFPTDLYALQSWAALRDVELRLVPSRDGHTLDDDDLDAALTDEVAFALLPTVLYRSGSCSTSAAGARWPASRGVTIGWDAAHSIGALPHRFHDDGADVAVWCSYKYLNGGPGAPGGLFVHRRHHDAVPALRGWWGHDKASQFAMEPDFTRPPAPAPSSSGPHRSWRSRASRGRWPSSRTSASRRSASARSSLTALPDRPGRCDAARARVVTPREEARRGGHVALATPRPCGCRSPCGAAA
jgi:kynureninase